MAHWPARAEALIAANPHDSTGPASVASSPVYKDSADGTPASPLTDKSYSTTSSQESLVLELVEPSSRRTLWPMSAPTRVTALEGSSDSLDFGSASPGEGSDRATSGSFGFSLNELPSPSLLIQQKYRSNQRGRLLRANGSQGSPSQHLQSPARRGNNSYRHLFRKVTNVGSGQSLGDMGVPEAAFSVEHLVMLVRGLSPTQPAVPVVAHGLHYMDSRAVAALLKDVGTKSGLPQRAIEIFEWLRGLQPTHELYHLCDVYTYTTAIALCGQRQSLRLALELVADMRGRGIACNVHTFSALMNTCIKCGELDLALDVFEQLKRERCVPNVVTFNTLVDVYGKLGRWQDAIRVIDQVYLEGLEPETRTFNTVIIAANICNQPLEALKVYERMVMSGFAPTDTTFTALISAYGKAGQLANAMGVFEQMVRQRYKPNIITYGSLISACERAGKWQLALRLLGEMQRDDVPPNTMTFNALLSACAQGAQSEKAEGLFYSMLARRCKPDAAAYSSVLLAHIRAGNWRAALQALETTPANYRSEASLYAYLIQCLWDSGIVAAQAHAARLFSIGMASEILTPALQQSSGEERALEVRIVGPNSSIAVLALVGWLRDVLKLVEVTQDPFVGHTKCLISVKSAAEPGVAVVDPARHAQDISGILLAVLDGLQSPFRLDGASQSGRKFVADAWRVSKWLQLESVKTAIMDYVAAIPSDARGGVTSLASRAIAAQETAAAARMIEEHARFSQNEKEQEARLETALPLYLGSRENCLKLANQLAKHFSISLEAVYCAMGVMDSALLAGMRYDLGQALVAACLTVAARICASGNASLQQSGGMEGLLELPPGSLAPVIDQLYQTRAPDLPIASPTTALNQYLGTLVQDRVLEGGRPGALHDQSGVSRAHARVLGSSRKLLGAAMVDPTTQHIRPSLLAAAALAADRRGRGVSPVWPAALARFTGIGGVGGATPSALDAAERLVAAVPVLSSS